MDHGTNSNLMMMTTRKRKGKAQSRWRSKKELDEEPNEGNEFAHELKKPRDAGKDEFEVDGKYKKKELDEEVVAEAPSMTYITY